MRANEFITEANHLYHTTTRKGISGMLKKGYILPSSPEIQHGWGFGATGEGDGTISMTRDPRYWAFDFADTQIILDSGALRHRHKVTPYGSHEEFEERVTKPIPFTNVYVKKVIFTSDRPGPNTLKKLKELGIPYVSKYPMNPVDQYKMYKEDAELDEMAGEVHGGVRKALKDKGYEYLGSGIDKQAYLEPGTGQVLIVFGYRKGVKDFSPDQRMFIDWINYCNQNKNNPHLPKFSGFESFEFQGKKYIQARMEKLNEVPSRIKELVSYLESAADHMGNTDIGTALKRLSSFAGNWDEEADEFKYDTVEQIVGFLGGLDSAADLLNTIYQVKEFSRQHGYSLDLHSGNYMQRADGTIVVNDPFVLWLTS